MVQVTVIASFLAGIASFLSPCVLPLIPGFLAYLSGTSLKDTHGARARYFLNSVAFVLGFSVVFAGLGVLLNTVLQSVSYTVQLWLSRLGGLIIIAFGLYLLGLIKISYLEREHKLSVKKKFRVTYLTSFVFGAAFAVGWTPCVGAVLGSILTLAATQPGMSFALLTSYSLGLGIPFLLVGLFTGQALALIKKSEMVLKYFNLIMGIFLITLGILVFTQTLSLVANWNAVNQILLS